MLKNTCIFDWNTFSKAFVQRSFTLKILVTIINVVICHIIISHYGNISQNKLLFKLNKYKCFFWFYDIEHWLFQACFELHDDGCLKSIPPHKKSTSHRQNQVQLQSSYYFSKIFDEHIKLVTLYIQFKIISCL